MNSFLDSLRPRLQAEPYASVIVITGNESADLDSIVSALTTSFFLSLLLVNKDKIILPFVNIFKADLPLRSDVDYVFHITQINSDLLFFRDDLPTLEQLASKNQLSLFLVDHNKVTGTMSSLANAPVVGLLDHHVDEKMYQDTADPRRIEVVGSCATLVAKEFLQNALDNDRSDQDDTPHHHDDANDGHPHPWVRHVARLLLGAILADTMNLDPAMGKVQPLDIAMADLAFPLTGLTSKDELYRKIEKARLDTSKIQFYDLLRKDYKEWTVVQSTTGQPIKVGMSSVVGLMEQYVERDGKDLLHEKIDQWAKERELDVIVVGLAGDDNGKFKRQVIVNPMVGFVGDLGDRLGHVLDLKMERISLVDTDAFVAKGGRAFWQHNFAASRKQVWPAVEKLLTQTEERRSGLVNQANI